MYRNLDVQTLSCNQRIRAYPLGTFQKIKNKECQNILREWGNLAIFRFVPFKTLLNFGQSRIYDTSWKSFFQMESHLNSQHRSNLSTFQLVHCSKVLIHIELFPTRAQKTGKPIFNYLVDHLDFQDSLLDSLESRGTIKMK